MIRRFFIRPLTLTFVTFGLCFGLIRTQPLPAHNKLGVHLLLDDGVNAWSPAVWEAHVRAARQVAGEWGYVTELIRGDDLNPKKWQRFMDLCAELHLTPIVRLSTTYNPSPHWWLAPARDRDGSYHSLAARYAAFVHALRWPTPEHYVIVGNEPNHGDEWSGRPDPAAYAHFFIDVADTLHAADPGVRVLNAGFDPYAPNTGKLPFKPKGMYYLDEETFLDQMVAAVPDVFRRVDIWNSHAYPTGPLRDGPWQQTYQIDLLNGATNPHHVEPPAGIHNRGVNGYEWEMFKLSTYGIAGLPVMITETGWRHAESSMRKAADHEPDLPDVAQTAQYLDMALYGNPHRYPGLPEVGWTPWMDDARVIAVTPFALDGAPGAWGYTNWLVLDRQGQITGTYPLFDLLAYRAVLQSGVTS